MHMCVHHRHWPLHPWYLLHQGCSPHWQCDTAVGMRSASARHYRSPDYPCLLPSLSKNCTNMGFFEDEYHPFAIVRGSQQVLILQNLSGSDARFRHQLHHMPNRASLAKTCRKVFRPCHNGGSENLGNKHSRASFIWPLQPIRTPELA